MLKDSQLFAVVIKDRICIYPPIKLQPCDVVVCFSFVVCCLSESRKNAIVKLRLSHHTLISIYKQPQNS